MVTIEHLLQYIIHIDSYLLTFVAHYGVWTYFVLFAIIFCETGLVVTPFLPGDSLIFAAGSIAANANTPLKIELLFIFLTIASILGNKLNYFIGRLVGPQVFTQDRVWLNKRHLNDAHHFYQKHGGKTIILARFLPVIRTFAPFVAGLSFMSLSLFSFYNVISAIIWIGSLLTLGYFLGKIPFIQENFSLVVYGVIAISVIPPCIAIICHKNGKPSLKN